MRRSSSYRIGDRIIYRMQKHGNCPCPRAMNVYAAPRGEAYLYTVDKYWMVSEVRPDGSLVAQTRRGKRREVRADDPNLRRASWWEKLWHQSRFPTTDVLSEGAVGHSLVPEMD